MKKFYLSFLFAFILVACTGTPTPQGTWLQPVPGMPQQTQGFRLHKGGKAESVNMATLLYTTWQINGNELTLTGQSLGNGQTIDFVQTYQFSLPNKDTLLLSTPDSKAQIFIRQTQHF